MLIYLHGFASGPLSQKAVVVKERLEKKGTRVLVPDLNVPDFEHLRPSLAIEEVVRLADREKCVLAGSSLGGLMALHVAARSKNVKRLVLLAPALAPDARWKGWLGDEGIARWKAEGTRKFFNFVTSSERPIDYGFYEDLVAIALPPPPRVPVSVIHGKRDEQVPVICSQVFAKANPSSVKLTLVDDDHSLLATTDAIVAEIEKALVESG